MSISRRTALATGAAAAVTGLTVAPLGMKAAGVQAALAGDPVLALEREWLAQLDYVHNYPDDSDDALEPLYRRADAIEEKIMGTPATTAAALAPSKAPRLVICIIGYSLALFPRGSIDRAKRLSIVLIDVAAT